MRAFVTDVHPLMTWGSAMLLLLSVCFIARRDIMVSALFPTITQVKDVWCLTNYITFFLYYYNSIQPANYIKITCLLSSCSCNVLPLGRRERGVTVIGLSGIEKGEDNAFSLCARECVYWV